jgi:signal transduction histidine kinase
VETSLAVSLAEHAKHFQSRTGLQVRLDIDPGVDAVLSSQARHELYRVAQQALDNVAAHARAARVEVVLGREDGRVTFRIVDDGRGFTDEERAAAAAGGHFGLISMRDRVGGLGGELRAVSAPGRGTTVEGWVPVERGAPPGAA